MKLTDHFERVYVINLPYKGDRKEKLSAHLEETGLADPDDVVWQTAVSGDWTGVPEWWGAGNGAWGCLLSHLQVVLDATMSGLENYLVLEDDVVFQKNAVDDLTEFMKKVPSDWGQIYLGGQYLHRDPEVVNDHVWRPYNVNRTHAFALNRSAFGRFQQHIMHAPDYWKLELTDESRIERVSKAWHIDHQLGVAHQRSDWNVYSPNWWIAGQEEGESNVSGRVNPRHWWQWWGYGSKLPFVWHPEGGQGNSEKLVHYGWSREDGSLVDAAVQSIDSPERAAAFADTISREAVGMQRLPGIESSEAVRDLISEVWEAGVIEGSVSTDQVESIYTGLRP